MFQLNVLGFQTHRDRFSVAIERDDIVNRVRDMRDVELSTELLRERYSLKDNRDWSLRNARSVLQNIDDPERHIIKCDFRPFDTRFCYFGSEFMDYPRRELIDHVAGRDNLQLLVSRQIGTGSWRHSFVAAYPPESCLISDGSTEQNYCFPLRLYKENGEESENLSSNFRAFIDTHYDHHYAPEEVLGYVYAALYARTYRERYVEFLRIDFPRVPFPKHSADFDTLSALGSTLIEAHLLREVPRRDFALYHGRGDNLVEFIRYSERDQAIAINTTQTFRPVPRDVWELHIGGYQVLDKYLKSRKGRALSLDEINHIGEVADNLAFTIGQMARIDEAYREAFPDVDKSDPGPTLQ